MLYKDSTLLRKINLSKNKIRTKGTETFLKTFNESSLTSLKIGDNKLDDNFLQLLSSQLERNKTLHFLDLSQNKFSEEGLNKFLIDLKEITASPLSGINLSSTKINNLKAFVRNIAQNKNLKSVHLTGLGINKNIIKFIVSELPHVINFNLKNNKLGNIGIDYLAEELRSYNSVKKINLSKNFITDNGLNYLSRIFEKNSLSFIKLNNNFMSLKGIKYLVDRALPSISYTFYVKNSPNIKASSQQFKDYIQSKKNITLIW